MPDEPRRRFWAEWLMCGRCRVRHYSGLDPEFLSHRRHAVSVSFMREVTVPADVARMAALFDSLRGVEAPTGAGAHIEEVSP